METRCRWRSSTHSGRRRSCERWGWGKQERDLKDVAGDMREVERRRSKTGGGGSKKSRSFTSLKISGGKLKAVGELGW